MKDTRHDLLPAAMPPSCMQSSCGVGGAERDGGLFGLRGQTFKWELNFEPDDHNVSVGRVLRGADPLVLTVIKN